MSVVKIEAFKQWVLYLDSKSDSIYPHDASKGSACNTLLERKLHDHSKLLMDKIQFCRLGSSVRLCQTSVWFS